MTRYEFVEKVSEWTQKKYGVTFLLKKGKIVDRIECNVNRGRKEQGFI